MRLIDADATIPMIKYATTDNEIGVFPIKIGYDAIVKVLNAQPTVDAEPVIRCKDCKLWMKNPYRESSVFGLCFKHKDIAIATDETDWCSWAERKEE